MEKQYAYYKEYDNKQGGEIYCIMYLLGKYQVGRVKREDNGNMMFVALRTYKTISGAEKYLLTKITRPTMVDGNGKFHAPIIKYATEAYIKKGEHWK